MVRRGPAHHPEEIDKILILLFQAVSMGRYVLVRVKGLEPPLPYGKQILSLPRLPFRHTRADRFSMPAPVAGSAPRAGG